MSLSSSCQFCERRFSKSYNLMIHERSHSVTFDDLCDIPRAYHSKKKTASYYGGGHGNSYLFVCDICGVGFKRHDGLKYHRASQHSPSTLSSSGSNSSGSSD